MLSAFFAGLLLGMQEHWQAGADDMRASLARPEFLRRPDPAQGVATHDLRRAMG